MVGGNLIMKPNFELMNRKELRTYMLEHRDDTEAFHAYMDKLNALPPTTIFPAPQSVDDLSNFSQLLEEHRRRKQEEQE
jgi:hypothetical protein